MSNTTGKSESSIPSLLGCPAELLLAILSHLDGHSLARISGTCRALYEISNTPNLWSSFSAHRLLINTPAPYRSWKDLYGTLHPYLYLGIQLWWLDTSWIGQLAASQYDPLSGKIQIKYITHAPSDDIWILPDVGFLVDEPMVELPQEGPYSTQIKRMKKFKEPLLENITLRSMGDIRKWYGVWPPLTIPADGRTSISDVQGDEVLDKVVKISIEKWHNWNLSKYKLAAVLERELWTPTEESPWRGIWAGDYGPHGIEFLLFHSHVEGIGECRKNGIRAIKLTGDPHVPRGELSFIVPDPTEVLRFDDIGGNEVAVSKALGQVADLGFARPRFIPCHIIFESCDKVQVEWFFEPDISTRTNYVRVSGKIERAVFGLQNPRKV